MVCLSIHISYHDRGSRQLATCLNGPFLVGFPVLYNGPQRRSLLHSSYSPNTGSSDSHFCFTMYTAHATASRSDDHTALERILSSQNPLTNALVSQAISHIVKAYNLDTVNPKLDPMAKCQHFQADDAFRKGYAGFCNLDPNSAPGLYDCYTFMTSIQAGSGRSPILRNMDSLEFAETMKRYPLLRRCLEFVFSHNQHVNLAALRRLCMSFTFYHRTHSCSHGRICVAIFRHDYSEDTPIEQLKATKQTEADRKILRVPACTICC